MMTFKTKPGNMGIERTWNGMISMRWTSVVHKKNEEGKVKNPGFWLKRLVPLSKMDLQKERQVFRGKVGGWGEELCICFCTHLKCLRDI